MDWPSLQFSRATATDPDFRRMQLDVCWRWFAIVVEKYSASQLTVATDKLAALSGLASVFHHRLGGRYFAGHWEFDFLVHLC